MIHTAVHAGAVDRDVAPMEDSPLEEVRLYRAERNWLKLSSAMMGSYTDSVLWNTDSNID